jgi:hypothetical protein
MNAAFILAPYRYAGRKKTRARGHVNTFTHRELAELQKINVRAFDIAKMIL